MSLSFEQSSYSVDEGDTVDVTVTLIEDPERTVTIPLTTTDQDGASSADYAGVPASVTFNAGDTEVDINFTAASDSDDDGESVKLTFGNTLPTGVYRDHRRGCGEITDDDVPSVSLSFEQSSYSVDEGDTVDVTVTLSDPERTVTIPITTTDQDGASSADYSGVPANVIFVPGDTEQTFTFTADEDTIDDDGESVKLGFGNTLPTGVSAGNTDEAVVTITDDDVPSVSVSFEQYSVDEGDGGCDSYPERGPGAHGHHTAEHHRPGRGVERRLLRRARQRHLAGGHGGPSPSPPPPTALTTMGRA